MAETQERPCDRTRVHPSHKWFWGREMLACPGIEVYEEPSPPTTSPPELHEVPLILKVRTLEDPTNPAVINRLAHYAAVGLNRIFGHDRFEIWHEGKRFVFDPLAHDGEHVGHDKVEKWVKE